MERAPAAATAATATTTPEGGHVQAQARGTAVTAARVQVRSQAKVGAAKDAAATRKLGQTAVAATRGPNSGGAQARLAAVREPIQGQTQATEGATKYAASGHVGCARGRAIGPKGLGP